MIYKKRYALLDDEGNAIRFFDYPAQNTIEITEPKLTFDEMLDKFGEALL